MQLVERHVIKRADPRFGAIDAAAFASKNLYNAANYVVRQSFIHEGIYLNYHEMHRRMKDHEAYTALPAKVAQWVLRLLDKNWQGFFAALAAWQEDPTPFLGRQGYRATRTSSTGAISWSTRFRPSASPPCAEG
jgi:putative transposase